MTKKTKHSQVTNSLTLSTLVFGKRLRPFSGSNRDKVMALKLLHFLLFQP